MESNNNQQQQKTHYLLFTGHMIDKPGRKAPRFPASKEGLAKAAITEKILAEKDRADPSTVLYGIASGACGGDILFHEICQGLGIPTQVYLALPPTQFLLESVAFAGTDWVERFNRLLGTRPYVVLGQHDPIHGTAAGQPGHNVWVDTNIWMLNSALVNGGTNLTLIALWDGKGGDGPGGTEDMIQQAKEKTATTIVIDWNTV